jgi:alpha-mannosidase
VRFALGTPLAGAREVNGAENPVGSAPLVKGDLVVDFTPYQVRTFALKLGPAPAKAGAPGWQAVTLPFDQAVASTDRSVSGGRFDSSGRSLAAEMLPSTLSYSGIGFTLGPTTSRNAVTARGQSIPLPSGSFTRLHLLAAAADGDQRATFRIGDAAVEQTIQDWGGYIGQWDNRVWRSHEEPAAPRAGQPAPAPGAPLRLRMVTDFTGTISPGYIKPAPVVWFASHRHAADGSNDPYAYSYLCDYTFAIPRGATTITLPVNERIKVMAITVEK